MRAFGTFVEICGEVNDGVVLSDFRNTLFVKNVEKGTAGVIKTTSGEIVSFEKLFYPGT
jgi:hypothetical protein